MNIIIEVNHLSKRYRIGKNSRKASFRRSIFNRITSPFSYLIDSIRPPSEEEILWAIQDISFEAQQGEVLGIIGRNGAGKSTLLKILSRITEPSSGKAIIRGRVGSLLEVGTGFHPELTGRENIFLNGTILGMKRHEINRKFDEIVAFAEIERFLNTPVKRYSSGMYVRLAFAVAAHLEPEILLIDEVLAVGDVAFQKRCLNAMGDIAKQGRTVLFVSHNLNAVQRLCSRVILIDHGQIAAQGSSSHILINYLSESTKNEQPHQWIEIEKDINRSGSGKAYFSAMKYGSRNEKVNYQLYPNGPLEVIVEIESDSSRPVESIAVVLYDQYGLKLVNADTKSQGKTIQLVEGLNKVGFTIDSLNLNPGSYVMGLWLANTQGEIFDDIPSVANVEVIEYRIDGLGLGVKADGLVTCKFDVNEVN